MWYRTRLGNKVITRVRSSDNGENIIKKNSKNRQKLQKSQKASWNLSKKILNNCTNSLAMLTCLYWTLHTYVCMFVYIWVSVYVCMYVCVCNYSSYRLMILYLCGIFLIVFNWVQFLIFLCAFSRRNWFVFHGRRRFAQT